MVTRTWGDENEVVFRVLLLALIPFCFQTDANDTNCEGVGTRWKIARNIIQDVLPHPNFLQAGNENAYLPFRAGCSYGDSRKWWGLDKPVPLQEQPA